MKCANVSVRAVMRRGQELHDLCATDAIYLNDDVEDAVERINAYLDAGADAGINRILRFDQLLKTFRSRIRGPLVVTSVDFQDTLAEESDAGASLSVYWPLLRRARP